MIDSFLTLLRRPHWRSHSLQPPNSIRTWSNTWRDGIKNSSKKMFDNLLSSDTFHDVLTPHMFPSSNRRYEFLYFSNCSLQMISNMKSHSLHVTSILWKFRNWLMMTTRCQFHRESISFPPYETEVRKDRMYQILVYRRNISTLDAFDVMWCPLSEDRKMWLFSLNLISHLLMIHTLIISRTRKIK